MTAKKKAQESKSAKAESVELTAEEQAAKAAEQAAKAAEKARKKALADRKALEALQRKQTEIARQRRLQKKLRDPDVRRLHGEKVDLEIEVKKLRKRISELESESK